MFTPEEIQFIHYTLYNSAWKGDDWFKRVLPLLRKIEDSFKEAKPETKQDDN